jgi:uridylate kinase
MYKRVLFNLSGEALAAGTGFGIDAIFIHKVAATTKRTFPMGRNSRHLQ